MTIDEVVKLMSNHNYVEESYVLVRELAVHLKVGVKQFYPRIGIRIWKSDVNLQYSYHFTVSHNVHTPSQATPYYPSVTCAATESEAIEQAISTTVTFLQSAIEQGHEPSESWLVPNEEF